MLKEKSIRNENTNTRLYTCLKKWRAVFGNISLCIDFDIEFFSLLGDQPL